MNFRPVVATLLALFSSSLLGASPYVGEEARSIKSLSADEVVAYTAGKGMGFAKAAELNGYPGPAHVLELADQLELSPVQRQQTQALFDSMSSAAIALGEQLIAAEQALDELFSTRTIDTRSLSVATTNIARIRGDLRRVHLATHLQQLPLLTNQQVARYNKLRGYTSQTTSKHSGHKHKHKH